MSALGWSTVLPVNHLLWGELHLGGVLLAVELCSSKSDVTRMFKQNGIRVNGERSQDRMLFLNDLRQRPDGTYVIGLRRGQHQFHWLEFTPYETTRAYASDYMGLVDGVHQWFVKSGARGPESEGWATREWGLWPGAIEGPWVHD